MYKFNDTIVKFKSNVNNAHQLFKKRLAGPTFQAKAWFTIAIIRKCLPMRLCCANTRNCNLNISLHGDPSPMSQEGINYNPITVCESRVQPYNKRKAELIKPHSHIYIRLSFMSAFLIPIGCLYCTAGFPGAVRRHSRM